MISQAVVLKWNSMSWTERAHQAGVCGAVALGFVLPISTSLTDALAALVLVLWFAAGHYKTVVHQVRSNPLVPAALCLFLILALGMLYSPVSLKVAAKGLKKYRELLYLIFLIPFLATEKHRVWAQAAFGSGMLVALVYSCFKYWINPEGLVPAGGMGAAFKDSLIHSFLLAVFAFGLMAHILFGRQDKNKGMMLGAIFGVVTLHLFFMVDGRTGFVLYFLLGILLAIQQFKWKGAVVGMLLLAGSHLGLNAVSETYSQQMGRIYDKSQVYLESGSTESSMGKRLDFIVNSARLWAERPMIGHGTGSFESRYAVLADARGLDLKTANPHNEYLMIGVQVGLVGVCALLYFIVCQGFYAFRLSPLNRNLALGVALLTAAGCMGNSVFLNHTEGMVIIYFTAVLFAPLTFTDNKKDA